LAKFKEGALPMEGWNVSKICRTVTSFFGSRSKNLGKDVGFVKRRSKLTAELFATAFIVGHMNDDTNLEQICLLLKEKGVDITPQGLHKRIGGSSKALLEGLFKDSLEQFKHKQLKGLELLDNFTEVNLLDSSSISLPESMEDTYKSCGGDASKAGLKLQVLFDYVNNQLQGVTLTEGRKNDQSFKEHLSNLKKGALYLQDLGYFSVRSFSEMESNGTYFVSRYLPQTKIYDKDHNELNITEILENSDGFFAREVYLGKKEKLKVRLVASLLPEEEVEKRQESYRKKARKSGNAPKKETLELARWSIYISNVPETMLKDEQLHLIYTLRWQIELFFKLCKSVFGLAKNNCKNPDHMMCKIYAKLVGITLLLCFSSPVRWQEKQELSLFKACKQLVWDGKEFFKAIGSFYRLSKFFQKFQDSLKKFALKTVRKKHPSTYKKLMDTVGQEVLT
jgi:hypothetical protein